MDMDRARVLPSTSSQDIGMERKKEEKESPYWRVACAFSVFLYMAA
jgi:hypothetical protein